VSRSRRTGPGVIGGRVCALEPAGGQSPRFRYFSIPLPRKADLTPAGAISCTRKSLRQGGRAACFTTDYLRSGQLLRAAPGQPLRPAELAAGGCGPVALAAGFLGGRFGRPAGGGDLPRRQRHAPAGAAGDLLTDKQYQLRQTISGSGPAAKTAFRWTSAAGVFETPSNRLMASKAELD